MSRSRHRFTAVRELIMQLREARQARGWSQMDLAEQMGTVQSTIGNLDRMQRADPQMSTPIRMADAMGITLRVVLEDPYTGQTTSIVMTGDGTREWS